MKILMVNKFLFPKGGAETYVLKLSEALISQGHEVQYFGMDHPNRIVGNSAASYTKHIDFHNSTLREQMTYPARIIYSGEARIKIRRVLDTFQPDVCHLNNFNFQLTPSIILEIKKWSRQTGKRCKIIYTAHDYQLLCPNHLCSIPLTHANCEKCFGGNYLNCLKNKCIHSSALRSAIGMLEGYFWRVNDAYRYIDTIICCSEFLKRKMDTNPRFAKKTIAMHNFVEPIALVNGEKKDYVLYFGRFSEEKGIRTLLKACKGLPDISFIFAGSGPLENELAGIPNVQNVGFQTGDALYKLICEAKFSVYPSEWYENCPFSVMESILLGTPVLGANIGGIPELILSGQTGELFESGNTSELTDRIRMMWDNSALLEKYSENCFRYKYSSSAEYAHKLINIYEA